jgi:hypothetical protein
LISLMLKLLKKSLIVFIMSRKEPFSDCLLLLFFSLFFGFEGVLDLLLFAVAACLVELGREGKSTSRLKFISESF